MSAATALSTLLDGLSDTRRNLRADQGLIGFVALVRQGIDTWEAALAAIDDGGDCAGHLAAVGGLFTASDELIMDTRTAEDMVRLGVGTPSHRLLAGLVAVRRELVRANNPVVALLRKAETLGKRTRSRWRGSQGREAAEVDRDLKLEEVRVAVKHLVEDLRALIDHVRRETRLE